MQEAQETQVKSLAWEDSLEKEMATHFSILAQEIPWTEEPGGLQSMESQRVGYDSVTKSPPDLLVFDLGIHLLRTGCQQACKTQNRTQGI